MGAAASEHEPSEIPRCGAKTRAGRSCQKTRGWGTDHAGHGHCKLHGGSSPNGQIHAAREHAAALALEYECEPHVALLRAVGQAARWELVCRQRVAALHPDSLVVEHRVERDAWGGENATSYTQTTTTVSASVWVKLHIQAVRDLASIAKTAIDAGVEERRVRLEERLATELADAIAAMLTEIGLTDEQRERAPDVVHRHLELLEGGKAA